MVMPRRRGLLRFALAFWLLSRSSFLLIAFIAEAHSLILLTLFFWIVESFPVPVYTRLMQAAYPARSRGRVIALIRVGMSFTSLVVTPLAGWLLDTAGHQALFPLLSFSAIISSVIFSRLQLADADLPESPPVSTAGLWRVALQDRRFLRYLAALVVFGLGLLSGLALQPLVQVDQLALSYGAIGLLGLVQSAFFLAGYVIWGRLIDRRGGVWVMRRVFLVAAVVPACYLAAVSGQAGPAAWLLAPAFAAMGLVNAGMDVGALNTVMQLAPAERLGEYSALQTTVLGARGLIAPFLGVWLAQSLKLPFGVVFGLGLALILAAALVLVRLEGDQANG
jgi:MFS family permease